MKILVADDEQAVRESLRRSLRFNGYDVVLAVDGEDALDQILQLFADWMKIPEGGHIQVNGNFSPDFAPETTLPLLKGMTDSGYLSEQTLFREVQRRGVISGDLDWEEEQQRIADQGPALGAL